MLLGPPSQERGGKAWGWNFRECRADGTSPWAGPGFSPLSLLVRVESVVDKRWPKESVFRWGTRGVFSFFFCWGFKKGREMPMLSSPPKRKGRCGLWPLCPFGGDFVCYVLHDRTTPWKVISIVMKEKNRVNMVGSRRGSPFWPWTHGIYVWNINSKSCSCGELLRIVPWDDSSPFPNIIWEKICWNFFRIKLQQIQVNLRYPGSTKKSTANY